MPKGQKKSKGVPELHDEVKKRVNLSLTPTAIAGLDKLAEESDLSRSELVEQIGRGMIPLAEQRSLSEEFRFSPIRSLPLAECDRLPEKMGAFLATDFAEFAYVGSSSNLRERFQDASFLEKKDQSTIEVLWIECDRHQVISRIEEELITQFHQLSRCPRKD
ncbi:MAG: ribbon-helix-helix protein, CopG family [Cyanobacteria bacterium J06621_8]